MNTKNVWLVTGASRGLGLTLVKKLLLAGYRVIATSRNANSLVREIGAASDSFLPLEMILADNNDVKKGIEKSIAHFGRIDVVVNNAGYGQSGTLEELTDEEVKSCFDVNVFGAINIIRNVLPYLRAQRSGHIFNISSIGGYTAAFPGWGIYCATKFAIAGITESLAEEVNQFGIHATVVYPGYFRTDFLSKDSIRIAANPIDAYESARQSEATHLNEINGNQSNDPEKAANILIDITKQPTPPVHLFLGKDAYAAAAGKISIIEQQLSEYKDLATATAFEE